MDRDRTSCRVRQDYGDYSPRQMPTLSDYTVRVRVTDIADQFTDVAEKKDAGALPSRRMAATGTPDRPCPTKVILGLSPHSDWAYHSQMLGLVTFQITESHPVSLTVTGMIQRQPGVNVGSDVVRVAFQANTGATLGATFTRASGTGDTSQVPSGQVWRFFYG